MEQLWPNAALLGRDGGQKPLRLGTPVVVEPLSQQA
jgi:hypothetical protein